MRMKNERYDYLSITSEITRINTNIAAAYSACSAKGAAMPQTQNSANLASTIDSISSGTERKALNLYDWEGTLLKSYTNAETQALSALPAPGVTHDLLTFQEWNRSLSDIKAWLTAHPHGQLDVGAIYTTTDGQDHNYWNNPRLVDAKRIVMQKRGTASAGRDSFKNLYSLTNINIPNGTPATGMNAFSSCYSLTDITIPNSVTAIGENSFGACYSLTNIIIPNSVTYIGNNTFSACNSLTYMNIPDSVTSIGNGAFSSCHSLTDINIPNGITSIGESTFSSCYSLTDITIPNSVTSIGNGAFGNCYSLNDVVIKGTPSLSYVGAFAYGPSTRRYYAYRENLSYFESATNWSSLYSQFVAIEDYTEYLNSIGIDV